MADLIKQYQLSALDLLAEMQQKGAPKQGSHGPAAVAAISLIVSSANQKWLDLDPALRESFSVITKKIAERFLLHKPLIERVKRSYCPNASLIENGLAAQLTKAGEELGILIAKEAPPLLALGLDAKQIGSAAFKLGFSEIKDIFKDRIFYDDDHLAVNRVNSLLNSADPRGLYSRIKSTYQHVELAKMGFTARVFLVLKPEVAEERVSSARLQVSSGIRRGAVAGYSTATQEQRDWFNEQIKKPGYHDCAAGLIRLAKLPEQKRDEVMLEIDQSVASGANHRDCINLILKEGYHKNIKKPFQLALGLELTSTAAATFAASEVVQSALEQSLANLRLLKSLPLDWSDDKIVRVVTGAAFYKGREKSSPIQTREDLIEGLRLDADAGFEINRSNPLQYATRRVLARLDHEQILQFYGIFFNPRVFPALKQELLSRAESERSALTATVDGGKHSLLETGLKAGKLKDPKFDSLCVALSDYLISIDAGVRSEARTYFYSWLIEHANKYYPAYCKSSPEVVAELAETTIRNYDPKSVAETDKKKSGLYAAFSGNIKHFYSFLIKHSLRESKPATRAYKLFSEMKTNMTNESGGAVPDSQVWSELHAIRPDLKDGILLARSEYERILKLKESEAK